MVCKKGISPLIATVLLLGFTVALATTVFLWMQSQTKTMSKSTVEYAEGEMQCQNIRINVVKSNSSTCNKLDISNKGYVMIDQLAIRTFNPAGSSLYPASPDPDFLAPQSTTCVIPDCGITKNVPTECLGCETVEVMPIIKIGERMVGCKDKTVVETCS